MSVSSEQYAELAELAGGFIHEIKNHLGTLNLNLQLLAEDFQEPQNPRERRMGERVHKLRNECGRLVELSNDFLRFARLRELKCEPTRLDELVGDMVDFVTPTAQASGVTNKCYWSADLPPVRIDRDLFKQALLNLMLNAYQAMPGGGELTIQAHHAEPDWVWLSLIDTGRGISPEVMVKLFKPFQTTRSGGTGLGLPLVKRVVEAHGGRVDVQSEVGRGTKFTLRLPVAT